MRKHISTDGTEDVIGVYSIAIKLILFGFIVYTALVVVPSIWEELTAEH